MNGENWKHKIFRILPSAIQYALIAGLTKYRLAKVNRLKTPTSVTFFVTSRCNARCKHCFYSKEIDNVNEMNIDQISALASSFKHPISLALTGGEPFLRVDLLEIAKMFSQTPGVDFLCIPTNGLLTNRIYSVVERILRDCKIPCVNVPVSLDGPEEIHDEIRGVKGAFKKALETIGALKELQAQYKTLSLNTITVVSGANYREIGEVVQALLPLHIPNKYQLARGSKFGVYNLPKDVASDFDPPEDSSFVPIDELPRLYSVLKNANQNSEYKFWPICEQLKLVYSMDMIINKRKSLPCYAAKMECVIYPDGDVSFCEMTKPFGILRDSDFNLHELWRSEAAKAMRRKISRCFCIHDCNLSTSMSLDAKTVLERLRAI